MEDTGGGEGEEGANYAYSNTNNINNNNTGTSNGNSNSGDYNFEDFAPLGGKTGAYIHTILISSTTYYIRT